MKQWFWDKQRRLYVDRSGYRLTEKEIREALDQYIESSQRVIAAKVAKYTAGDISITDLFLALDEEITALHGASGSIAYGGIKQMDLEKWSRIEERLQPELSYLSRFQLDLAQAANIATPGTLSTEAITNRAQLYPEAAYSEYMNQRLLREEDSGVTVGRRICESDGTSCDECVEAATEEFIPLDDIPEIGTLQCMNNCRCEIEFDIHGVQFAVSELFTGVIGGQEEYGGSVDLN